MSTKWHAGSEVINLNETRESDFRQGLQCRPASEVVCVHMVEDVNRRGELGGHDPR